jgi:hypothetical protein
MKYIIRYCLAILTLTAIPQISFAQRQYGGFYTREKIQNLRNNCNKYDWAKELKNAVINSAKNFASKER